MYEALERGVYAEANDKSETPNSESSSLDLP